MPSCSTHILLTGPPGCGKTTVIQCVIERLTGVKISGFYTQEIREQGRRTGFEMVGLGTGRRVLLASQHSASELRLRRYGIELSGLEEVVELELQNKTPQLFVIDEIGKIELYSQKFIQSVERILDGDVPIIGTVAIRGGGLIQEAKLRSDTQIIEVDDNNRNHLPTQIAGRIQECLNPH
jgi:nucleoside-triphosphatase